MEKQLKLKVGQVQRSALEIYIFDSAHDAFPGQLVGGQLVVEAAQAWQAREMMYDACNSADNDKDSQLRSALEGVCRQLSKFINASNKL